MKKSVALLLMFLMVFGLCACGSSTHNAKQNDAENYASDEPAVYERTNTEIAAEDNSGDETETPQGNNDILVAYFSATNTTKGVAEKLADGLNADLYQITPEDPYTDDDLDYNDNKSRSTIEMNDPDARPAIAGSVENMEQYKVIFIGYPIWWGNAPRIISTFLESYDFNGKTIIPFCTSASSGIGSSASGLAKLTGGADWLEGKRFSGSDSKDTIMKWADSIDISK